MQPIQVTDTVRAVHTHPVTGRRAFFATVLSVQPKVDGDNGTNGEPTITIAFIDHTKLSMLGSADWHKAFVRIPTVRHVSHDEAQQCATEYCWTDHIPSDELAHGLNMYDLSAPAAKAEQAQDTVGTIVYVNHKNGLDVFHGGEGMFRVHFAGEDHDFSDPFSAQVFVDAQPSPEPVARTPWAQLTEAERDAATYPTWDGVITRSGKTQVELDVEHAEQRTTAIETKEYTDGTTATGVVPLPDQSPAQQDAAAIDTPYLVNADDGTINLIRGAICLGNYKTDEEAQSALAFAQQS